MSASPLVDLLTGFGARAERAVHIEHIEAREGRTSDWPDWLEPSVVDALRAAGIERPWTHQVAAAETAHRGEHVILATGTASGKSLGYLLPVLDATVRGTEAPNGRGATALYIAPTKALAADQEQALRSLVLRGLRPSAYDGDTAQSDRDWARRHANLILTNPDMLHRSILPGHARFASVLRTLRFIVVDEAHRYRGVFGSHVALILRRLVRLARRYGASPVVIGASATAADPAEAFSRLIGAEASAVVDDGSPRAAGDFLLWEPTLLPGEDPNAGLESDDGAEAVPASALGLAEARRSSLAEAADLLIDTTCAGRRAIGFIASRRGAEALAGMVRDGVSRIDPSLTKTVAAYRGGYLPEERRLLETGLRTGRLMTLASTNALELGIDISGLDVVVIAGWPGTLASLRQQAGRAGRAGREWAAVFVARDDPLDSYLVHHPARVFDHPVDTVVIDPGNPYVLAGHLCAAAAELPLTEDDLPDLPDTAPEVLDQLVAAKMLRRRPAGWYWTKAERAADLADIRSAGGGLVRYVEASSGALLGTVDAAGAHAQAHPGAVYVHQGRTFAVLDLDLEEGTAFVEETVVDYTTQAQSVTEIAVVETAETRPLPSGGRMAWGTVDVSSQVTGYRMRQLGSGRIIGQHSLELPPQRLRTTAVWWTAPQHLLDEADCPPGLVPGAVHAAEHAAIGLLPLFAGCDRWDIGGVSTASHADTGQATVFVYDGQPGGAGFAERGFEAFVEWQEATQAAIAACECADGCPSCVQSPKCGNGNEPLEKDAAERLLSVLLSD